MGVAIRVSFRDDSLEAMSQPWTIQDSIEGHKSDGFDYYGLHLRLLGALAALRCFTLVAFASDWIHLARRMITSATKSDCHPP